MIKFDYNKKNAWCVWCKRTENPHPDFKEPIPTNEANEDFYKFLDDRFEKLLMLDNMRRF